MQSTRIVILFAAMHDGPDPWEWNVFYSPSSPHLALFVRNVSRSVKAELTAAVMR